MKHTSENKWFILTHNLYEQKPHW